MKQTISQNLSPKELQDRLWLAVDALRADRGPGQAARESNGQERCGGKAPHRAEKPRTANASLSKKDKIIQENDAVDDETMHTVMVKTSDPLPICDQDRVRWQNAVGGPGQAARESNGRERGRAAHAPLSKKEKIIVTSLASFKL